MLLQTPSNLLLKKRRFKINFIHKFLVFFHKILIFFHYLFNRNFRHNDSSINFMFFLLFLQQILPFIFILLNYFLRSRAYIRRLLLNQPQRHIFIILQHQPYILRLLLLLVQISQLNIMLIHLLPQFSLLFQLRIHVIYLLYPLRNKLFPRIYNLQKFFLKQIIKLVRPPKISKIFNRQLKHL